MTILTRQEADNMRWGGSIRWRLALRDGYALVGLPTTNQIKIFNPARDEWRPELVAVG